MWPCSHLPQARYCYSVDHVDRGLLLELTFSILCYGRTGGGVKKQGAYGKICVVPLGIRERVLSMFRLDELALKVLFLWDKHRKKCQRQKIVDDDMDFGYHTLVKVSRSFASVIQLLPDE